MSRQKNTSRLLVFALAGLTVLAGCASQQRTKREPATRPTARAQQPAQPRTTTPAPSTSERWPTKQTSSAMNWSSLAFPTGEARTSAIGIEKGMPREVRMNQPFDYKIVVTNLTQKTLRDVVVTDKPGDHLHVTSATPPQRPAPDGGMMWSLGTLGPRESKTITVNASATTEGTVGSCASVAYNSQLCTTVPVVQPKLRLTKTGPSQVMKCEEITYRFEVANTGTGTIRNVRISDPLPAGLAAAGGGRALSFDAGTLAPGQSRSFTGRVKAERTGRFENRATAAGEGGLSAQSGSVVTVVRQPKLTITKKCPGTSFIGRALEYTITVTNTGDGDARETVIEDQIPSGTTFVSASDGGRAAAGKVVWNVGTLQPRGSKTVTMRLNPTDSGTFRNTATARATCADPVSDSCQSEVTGIPAILLEVVDVEDPDQVGTNETYVITVTNQGSAPGTNIRIVCTLEPNQEFVSASGATNGVGRGNTVTFDPIRSLPAKQRATFRVVVRNVRAGDVRFTVSMNSDQLTRSVDETEATNVYE